MSDIAWPLSPPAREGVVPATAKEREPEEALEVASRENAVRFRQLVDAHFAFIWRALRGLGVPSDSADDAAQHVFWIAAQKLPDIVSGSERSFLFGTALGVAANARRARARHREVLDDEAIRNSIDETPNGEELLDLRRRRELLDQVLASMPDDLRVVFVLFVLEGITAREIAGLLDVRPGTVASRLRRARQLFHSLSARLQAREARGGR